MSTQRRVELSVLLDEVRAGGDDARNRLVRAIYAGLRRIAHGLMHQERPGRKLQPGALVDETLIRLLEGDVLADVPNRRYHFAAAARAMRQVLVDHVRRHGATKSDPGGTRQRLDEALNSFEEQGLDVIDLHEALPHLTPAHLRPAQAVDLRFVVGLTVREVAAPLDVSDTTVEADWRFARAWPRDRLGGPLA
jgi:RNA polymerase sigma factor (TIGR02999 family)